MHVSETRYFARNRERALCDRRQIRSCLQFTSHSLFLVVQYYYTHLHSYTSADSHLISCNTTICIDILSDAMPSLLSKATILSVGLTCKAFLNSPLCGSITVTGLEHLTRALDASTSVDERLEGRGQGVVTGEHSGFILVHMGDESCLGCHDSREPYINVRPLHILTSLERRI